MLQLRRLLPLVLCFSLCLTVCVFPAFANDIVADLVVPGDFAYIAHSNDYAIMIANPFVHFSATLDYASSNVIGGMTLYLQGDVLEVDNSANDLVAVYRDDVYFEVVFPVGSGDLVISDANVTTSYNFYQPPLILPHKDASLLTYSMDLLVDDVVVASANGSYGDFIPCSALTYNGTVNNRFSLRYRVNTLPLELVDDGEYFASLFMPYDIFTFEGNPLPVDKIDVVIGKIDVITGNVQQIQSSIVEINNKVNNIDNTVTDMSNQLQEPSSSIWQAAGSAISNTIESLFVPSSEDLEDVKRDFDALAQDKLGGAYTAMETVDDTITQVNDKLNNPSAAEGIEFPGISVPLGGEVGTVTLADRQMVTLPTALTAVLHPLAGTIVSIICGLGTFNVLKDMAECFLSGYSFAEYLHRNKGGSDE